MHLPKINGYVGNLFTKTMKSNNWKIWFILIPEENLNIRKRVAKKRVVPMTKVETKRPTWGKSLSEKREFLHNQRNKRLMEWNGSHLPQGKCWRNRPRSHYLGFVRHWHMFALHTKSNGRPWKSFKLGTVTQCDLCL